MGVTGVRDGSTMRAVSRFTMLGAEAACSGRGGSAIRTVSFFGSAMCDQRAIKKIAQTGVCCHLLICITGKMPVLRQQIVPAAADDPPPHEFSHRRRFGKNHARVHVRRVGFGPRDEWLVDEQTQFAPDL